MLTPCLSGELTGRNRSFVTCYRLKEAKLNGSSTTSAVGGLEVIACISPLDNGFWDTRIRDIPRSRFGRQTRGEFVGLPSSRRRFGEHVDGLPRLCLDLLLAGSQKARREDPEVSVMPGWPTHGWWTWLHTRFGSTSKECTALRGFQHFNMTCSGASAPAWSIRLCPC
jgi:hypothetical protein